MISELVWTVDGLLGHLQELGDELLKNSQVRKLLVGHQKLVLQHLVGKNSLHPDWEETRNMLSLCVK